MKGLFLYMVLFLLLGHVSFSQIKKSTKAVAVKKAKTSDLGIGVGLASSYVFLAQNISNRNNALGYVGTVTYGPSIKPYRASMEYTVYKNINIEPTWKNVKASCAEFNLHCIWRFHKVKSYLFLISGVSYNIFSGYFTGQNDFLNFRSRYAPNETVTKKWLGFNAGLGYELYLKNACAFITYKMRVGNVQQNSELNIMDVCIALGLRFNLSFPSPSFKRIFRGTRNRYLLDT